MKKEIKIVGTLLILLSLISIYISIDDVRIRVDNDKSVFYIKEKNRWVISGIEENRLFNGTKLVYRNTKNIVRQNNVTNYSVIITRKTPYRNGGMIIDTYEFDGQIDDIELFPISHTIEVINSSGLIYQYDVKRLVYEGETIKDIESPQSFGRNMNVEWKQKPYYSRIWKYKRKDEGKLTLKYRIKSNYEKFNIRLFDPPLNGKLKVIENTDQCLIDCYTIYEYTPSKDHNSDFNVKYYREKISNEKISNELSKVESEKIEKEVVILENITKKEPIKKCRNISYWINEKTFNNKTNKNETKLVEKIKQECKIVGYKTYYELVEKTGKMKDKKFKRNEKIIFKISGKKKPFENIDNVVFLGNKEWKEYAWWNSSWSYKREITITTDYNYTHYPANFSINLSAEYSAGKVNQTCKDIRFTNSAEDTELYYDIVICNLSNSDIATFSVHLDEITTENETIYMYYGNPIAETTENYFNTYYRHDSNLVLDMPFKLGSGSTAWDVSGAGNNGTITNAQWVSGGGMSFDGDGDWIDIDDSFNPNFNLITLYAVGGFFQTNYPIIVGTQVSGWSNDLVLIFWNDGIIRGRRQTISTNYDVIGNAFTSNGDFYSYAFTVDAGGMELYVNGSSEDTNAYVSSATRPDWEIGSYHGGNNAVLNGTLAQVKIYNTSLTPTQISLLYNETQYPPTFSFGEEEERDLISIFSPENKTYNTTEIDLNWSGINIADAWYSLNGGTNISLRQIL